MLVDIIIVFIVYGLFLLFYTLKLKLKFNLTLPYLKPYKPIIKYYVVCMICFIHYLLV